jgi:UrcA family protein
MNGLRLPMAVALAAAIVTSSPAAEMSVSGRKDLVSRTVTYAAADLRDPVAAKRLAFRIVQAASYVCGGDSLLVRTGQRFQRCRRQATERGLASLNAPVVTAAVGDLMGVAARESFSSAAR